MEFPSHISCTSLPPRRTTALATTKAEKTIHTRRTFLQRNYSPKHLGNNKNEAEESKKKAAGPQAQ